MRSDLIATTQNVWSRLFQRGVEPSLDSMPLNPEASGVSSAIRLKGSAYALIIHAGEKVARRWAGTLFDCDPQSCTDADLIDVVGELSNVVSGAFKQRITTSVDLALPDVRFGLPSQLFESGSAHVSVAFEDDIGPFWVILWQIASDPLDEKRSP